VGSINTIPCEGIFVGAAGIIQSALSTSSWAKAGVAIKENEIKLIQSSYKLQLQVDEENRLKDIEHENLQRQQNEQLLSDFNRLNQGRAQVFREPNETEDDFYLRLVAMGNVEIDPADIEKQIQTDILLKAKKNIFQLTDNESTAETVIKMLNNEERFQMNKVFPKIKRRSRRKK